MRITQTVRIDAPADAVWDVMSDVRRWPEWTGSITSVEPLQEGPLAVGGRYRVRQPRLPVAVWEVVDVVPGASFTWTNRSPGVASTGTHSVTTGADGVVTAELVLEQVGPASFLLRPFAGLARRYVAMEAAGLKSRSEQLAGAGGRAAGEPDA